MAEARKFTNVNGNKWAYLRRGKGVPLVILHGFMCYADYFKYFMEELENDFDIIVPDLPGFGFTPKLKQNTYENIANDTKDFLRQLNLDKTNIFGVSLGGAIAMEYAMDYPHKVKTLFLNSPFWSKKAIGDGPIEKIEFKLMDLPDSVLNILKTKLVFKELANMILNLRPRAKKIFRTHERQTLEAISLLDIDGNRELLNSLMGVDLEKRLKNYKTKTVIIAGLLDDVVPPKSSEILQKIIGGDLVTVKNQTHEFIIESPDKLVNIIKTYILTGQKAQEKDFLWV